MATRRKFLSLIGVGAASAPLAAKELADKQIADLVIRGDEAAPLAPSAAHVSHFREDEERAGHITQALEWIKANGIPEHMERRYRRDAQYVSALDPDIANKRSWSMAVKINEQRQRNYRNQLDQALNEGGGRRAREAFQSACGFKWPW